ncbi:MAG: N-acetylglucosamine kinase [Nitrososphaerales archaeon]
MDLVIGIDGGGSKTQAVVADLGGRILGRGKAGASNYQGVGLAAAQVAIDRAIESAFADAGLPQEGVRAACLGLAGVGRADDRAVFDDWIRKRLPGAAFRVANDAELVLAAGSNAGWGLAVIAGTGSIASGRNPAGSVGRAGGWGPLLGDEGSGYAIGRSALRAAVSSHDGRISSTALLPAILAHWGLADVTGLIAKAYRPPLSPSSIAELAVLVENAAEEGDAVASAILAEAGNDLAMMADAVARGLGLKGELPCAVAGSVLVKGRKVREAFEGGLVAAGVTPTPLVHVEESALGAVRLARELLAGA